MLDKFMSDPKQPPKLPSPINNDDLEVGVAIKERPKTKRPSMYKVLMLNDDYTPMEFVIYVLQSFFEMWGFSFRRRLQIIPAKPQLKLLK